MRLYKINIDDYSVNSTSYNTDISLDYHLYINNIEPIPLSDLEVLDLSRFTLIKTELLHNGYSSYNGFNPKNEKVLIFNIDHKCDYTDNSKYSFQNMFTNILSQIKIDLRDDIINSIIK